MILFPLKRSHFLVFCFDPTVDYPRKSQFHSHFNSYIWVLGSQKCEPMILSHPSSSKSQICSSFAPCVCNMSQLSQMIQRPFTSLTNSSNRHHQVGDHLKQFQESHMKFLDSCCNKSQAGEAKRQKKLDLVLGKWEVLNTLFVGQLLIWSASFLFWGGIFITLLKNSFPLIWDKCGAIFGVKQQCWF